MPADPERWTDLTAGGALPAFRRHFEAEQARIESFVDEAGRFDRIAAAVEALAAVGGEPGALDGVPLGVKDVFRVDGLPTRAGSRLPAELFAGAEATCVSRLRRAGAIVVGKTETTDFAYFAPARTRNPHHPEHTPGGSSSGSAAAVAAAQCVLALGTQTIGSVGRPAAYCGVVGFKPSRGRVPAEGLIPLAPSLDQIGLFAPDVAWALAGAALLCDGWRPAAVFAGDERPPVLGVPEGPYLDACAREGREHFAGVSDALTAAGLAVRPVPALADFADVAARHRRIVAAEAAAVHAAWYAEHRRLYRRATAELIEQGRAIAGSQLAADLAGRERLRRQLAAAMEAHGVDLWISPPAPGPAPRGLESTGDPVMNLPWTHAGLPTVVVPAGRRGRLPMGLQLAGRHGADEPLLGWAGAIAELVG